MIIDKKKIRTQDELDEPAPIEQANARAKAKMKELQGKAKKDVAEGLQNKRLAKEGEKLRQEGKRNLRQTTKAARQPKRIA
jgi:hypothetical protein